MSIELLMAGHSRFVQTYWPAHEETLRALADKGQSPKTMVIGCADSRVPPEIILDAAPGDVFVVRGIANVVPPFGGSETGVGAAIEYAVLHLHVAHLIVLGHTDCGGLKALDATLNLATEPYVARWVEYARSAQTMVDARGVSADERGRAIVRENVKLQLHNLRTYPSVRDAESAGKLTLHGWVYVLADGGIEAYNAGGDAWKPA
jgi:carbonic anhydrase